MVKNDPGRPIRLDSVPILLHEYDTLRAQLIQNHSNLYQVLIIVVTAIFSLGPLLINANTSARPRVFWLSLSLFAIPAVVAILFRGLLMRDIEIAAERLREIEDTVDEATGEWYLLRHERLSGGGGKGLFGLAQRRPVPLRPDTSTAVPPSDPFAP